MRHASSMVLCWGIFSLAACGGPMGPIPGGELEGEELAWPADWSFSDDVENILLETNPSDPYSVTVWGVYVENDVYVVGATAESRWVQNLLTNPRARFSVSGDIYTAWVEQVEDDDSEATEIEIPPAPMAVDVPEPERAEAEIVSLDKFRK